MRLAAWCADRPEAVTLLEAHGPAPLLYILQFRCASVAELPEDGPPVLAESQTVRIQLHSSYPIQGPQVTVLTPVAHPNIFPSGNVCLGEYWSFQRTLDQLADTLWKLLVWAPEVTNPDSPANGEAAAWYEDHRDLTPFDRLDPMEPKPANPTEPAQSGSESESVIVWNTGG